MEYYRLKRGGLGLRAIPQALAEFLRLAPRLGRDSEKAEARFFPAPSLDAAENTLRQDWKAVVEPDLHEIFQSARDIVEADIRGLREDHDGFLLEIPTKHIDAWLNVMNQARLALAAEHDLKERELSAPGPIHIRTDRDLALLQINFFAAIQHLLIEELDAG